MENLKIDGTRLVPPGPPPPRPPQHLARRDGAGFAVEAARVDLNVNLRALRLLQKVEGAATPDRPSTPPGDAAARTRAFVKEIFERHGIAFEEMSPEEAEKRVGPDGPFSPEAVSGRILDFVKGFATGEPGRASLLRDAVARGFAEAEEAFGGKLPDVSYRTMDLVRKGLDELFGPETAPEEAETSTRGVDIKA